MLEDDNAARLYNTALLSYIEDLPRCARLENPDVSATALSAICGSSVTLDLILHGHKIEKIGHEIEACALTETVLAVFLKTAPGLDYAEIKAAQQAFFDWLSGMREDLPAAWRELDILEPARSHTARHESMLLPFKAALGALDKIAKDTL